MNTREEAWAIINQLKDYFPEWIIKIISGFWWAIIPAAIIGFIAYIKHITK